MAHRLLLVLVIFIHSSDILKGADRLNTSALCYEEPAQEVVSLHRISYSN